MQYSTATTFMSECIWDRNEGPACGWLQLKLGHSQLSPAHAPWLIGCRLDLAPRFVAKLKAMQQLYDGQALVLFSGDCFAPSLLSVMTKVRSPAANAIRSSCPRFPLPREGRRLAACWFGGAAQCGLADSLGRHLPPLPPAGLVGAGPADDGAAEHHGGARRLRGQPRPRPLVSGGWPPCRVPPRGM